MSNGNLSRRQLLAATATVGATSLAGCSRDALGNGESTDESAPEPQPPEQTLTETGWEQLKTTPIEETTTVDAPLGREVSVTARGTSNLYEDARLRARIREGTLGAIDNPLRVFFATKLELDPNVLAAPFDLGSDRVLDVVQSQIESSFKQQLSEMGLEGMSLVEETTIDIKTGESARFYRYESTFPYDDFTVPLTEEKTHTIEGGELRFESLLVLWGRNDQILVAGGGYPGENFTTSEHVEVTDLITADIDIDLKLTPDAYRTDLRDLITRVE